MSVNHQILTNTANTTTPYQVDAEVFSPTGSAVTAKLFYRLNGGSFIENRNDKFFGRIFGAQIPAQPLGTFVEYYIEGTTVQILPAHRVTRPSSYTHLMLPNSTICKVEWYSNTAGKIVLTWDDPQL
ncbi:MAG: hypothetical protein IPN18_14980 [Ignavibacteriales bacterium]|nr:hypothetical protein [Ignavibacteriales bacterium]